MFPNMNTSDGPPATIHIEESQAPCSAVALSTDPSPASVPIDLDTQEVPRNEFEEDLSDVTISCAGGKQFSAHRLVLATCSSYFRQLFFSV